MRLTELTDSWDGNEIIGRQFGQDLLPGINLRGTQVVQVERRLEAGSLLQRIIESKVRDTEQEIDGGHEVVGNVPHVENTPAPQRPIIVIVWVCI